MGPQAAYDWLPTMCEQYRRDGVLIGDASCDVYLSLQEGRSPMKVALSKGNVKCIQLLVDKGANVNEQNEVSSFHHEMRSLPLVHVYHVPLYEWSISSEVSLISPPSFHP